MGSLLLLSAWFVVAARCHSEISKHARHHIDAKPEHRETLMWTVSLRDNATYESVVFLATGLDMDVLGPCHVVDRCFVLAHKNHSTDFPRFSQHDHTKHNHLHHHSKINYDINTSLLPDVKSLVHRSLDRHPDVTSYTDIWIRNRFKRTSLSFEDPYFQLQWHLVNEALPAHDINVTGVWERNVTGRGVTVAIVDDGLEWDNPDLAENYNKAGSYDLDGVDDDPMPDETNQIDFNAHGTRCAGEVAAVPNNVCAVGVAYRAKVAGIRVLDGTMTDVMEAAAFTMLNDVNDIYSCSWGPQDDGKTVDGPHRLAKAALIQGVTQGRKGYGSIFVLASGNGGYSQDNCNFDGYANSIYTVTIGAIDENYGKPPYAEDCAAMLAVTYSSGNGRYIATTDVLHTKSRNGCTTQHSGTSAAAPIASAMVALMLDARPCLSWRDVQYIIAMSAVKVDHDATWATNAAGLQHSHSHGFGVMNAWRLVNAAKVWISVPPMVTVKFSDISKGIALKPRSPVLLTYNVAQDVTFRHGLLTLEYVQVTVKIGAAIRGNIKITLTCPSGMPSELATVRPNDKSEAGFYDWTFSTVRCWGEEAAGRYTLEVETGGDAEQPGTDILHYWSLTLHGSSITSRGIQERIELIQNASSGYFLRDDVAVECGPALQLPTSDPTVYVSDVALKILAAVGCLLLVVAIYELVEVVLLRKLCWTEPDQREDASQQQHRLSSGGASDQRASYAYVPVPGGASVVVVEEAAANGRVQSYPADADEEEEGRTGGGRGSPARTSETTSLLLP